MNIEIRPIETHQEYQAVEQVQREAWGLDDVDIVPNHMLLTAQKNGGLLLGAFDTATPQAGPRLVGFVFGFAGLLPDGKIKHCSHMAGVIPAYQNQNVGYHLKLAQRQHVLNQGLDLVTWTFDPLESRNAYLNFHKLGATCRTYLRDLYGNIRDALNVGLPTDRFQVDWHVTSAHVAERLRGDVTRLFLSALQSEGVPVLNRFAPEEPPRPPQTALPIEGPRLLLQVPARFQTIKAADMALARAWRLHTRELFEAVFARQYAVTDLLFEGGESYYLLERDWQPL